MKSIKILFAAMIAVSIASTANAQVKVGNNPTTINTNSVLEVESTNKGLLLPRVALTGTTNVAPLAAHVAGMTVYNTATAGDVIPGYYYNDGTKWVRLADASSTGVSSNIYTADGTLAGNRTVTQGANSLNFAGTGATTFNSGNVGIGTTNPQSKLDITGRIIQRGPTANNLNYYLKTNGDDLWPEDPQGTLSPGILVGPALGMDWGAYGPGDGSSLRLFAHNGAKINFSRTNFNPTSHFDFETLMQIDTYDGTVHIGGDYGGDGERLTVGGNVRFSGALMPAGAAGTVGQVLTSSGPGVAPTWVNAAAVPTEPWFNVATGTGATANTQNIYQLGNVGIGTTNPPQSALDVTGAITQRGPLANNMNYYMRTNGNNNWGEDREGTLSGGILVAEGFGMDFGAYGLNDGQSLRLFTPEGGYIAFAKTNGNPTSQYDFTTLMQIWTASGNVSIGNAFGQERLDVEGNVRFTGALMPAGAAGTAGQVLTSAGAGVAPTWVNAAATPTEPWFNAATGTGANANTQNIYQMGNVGIGRTNPESQLDVQGRIVQRGPIGFSLGTYMHTNAGNSWEDSGELFPGLLFQNSSFRINGIDAGFGGQDRTRTRIFSSQEISFSKVSPNPTSQADFIDLMLITEAGNVGIGVGQQGVVRSRLVVRGLPIYADNNAAKVALGSVLDGYKDAIGAFYHNGDGILRVVF